MTLFLQIITPLLVVIASYAFGIATKKYELRIKVYRERYDNLYAPFINWLVHSPLDWNSPGRYTPAVRRSLMKLLLENSKYMGEKSGSILKPLYDVHLKLNEVDIDRNINTDNVTSPTKYNDLFIEISYCLLEESSQLSCKLQLPDLAKNVVIPSYTQKTHAE